MKRTILFLLFASVSGTVLWGQRCSGSICHEDFHPDAKVYYQDSDGDGYGNKQACTCAVPGQVPAGYVDNAKDCDDTDRNVTVATSNYWKDGDGDGFGDPNQKYPFTTCVTPSGYVDNNDDCDDSDGNIKPGGNEICDGKDNDCDGQVDESTVGMPAAASVTITDGCGEVTLSHTGPTTWYWQTSSTGTSQADNDNPKTVSSGTVIYLRAKSGNCWSTAREITYDLTEPTIHLPGAVDKELCTGGGGKVTFTPKYLAASGEPTATHFKWYTATGTFLEQIAAGESFSRTVSQTTTYQVSAIVSSCEGAKKTVTATVHSIVTAGAIGGGESICYDGDPASISSTSGARGGNGTYQYQWEYSDNNANGNGDWHDISGATATVYDPPSGLRADRWYRRKVTSCDNTKATGAIKVTVYGQLNPGGITGADTICFNGDPQSLDSSMAPSGGDGNYVYKWEYSDQDPSTGPGGANWLEITGATVASYDPPIGTYGRPLVP